MWGVVGFSSKGGGGGRVLVTVLVLGMCVSIDLFYFDSLFLVLCFRFSVSSI